ncbi:unnamed protein product [Acanthoscelides obtectus]|uniref:Tyrosine-protein phosphatase non-receptor type 23 n=1 Tax=Acanthoscelides obtectus TaxID=200917 RepID=A0A9P0K7N4_ACAOB|nr:unnamed protein product [Acanthoscelides obtectus]CAK1666939.1 Tyrosine-protein phosphatase non-receptor type 23 [Acanthoscelides obtectus]
MEAVPRLPMLSFELKVCTENTQFAPQLKQYIAAFYNEDPDSYLTEIHSLEALRASAVRPSMDISGVQTLKKYYCQLHFLKSRFPMEENQDAAVQFSWRDNQLEVNYSSNDIRFELMVVMYNIGALHSYLGANESRSNPDGMRLACTHFQCAAWAFQCVKEKYHQFIVCISLIELVHFFQQVCLAQAQECILEKSMLDNRKATIVAKVAVQVYNYYRQSLSILESSSEDLFKDKKYKEWIKYLNFKMAYYKCVSLLYQGQQAEEQQKMGERVAFYQAACDRLEEAKKWAGSLKKWQQEINESLAFTQDVAQGKKKAASNENEFIYHEEVPDKDHLEEVKGASLVKGIPFSVSDVEISGPDIFQRLVPMEAHEAASLYSEKKAQLLRQVGDMIESKDQQLVEFMSSMQFDVLSKVHQATGLPQEIIDRAAAMSARPTATQELSEAMNKLSSIYQDVEANLKEIDALLKEEEEAEQTYQSLMGKRPPSIVSMDLSREAAKYREAHVKANESNQTLHRAMTAHVANLKILQQPLKQLTQQLPSIELPNPNVDDKALKGLDTLVAKVDEMRTQRAMLWAQLREAVHQDDITNSLVTKQPNQSLEQLFQQEIEKHNKLTTLIEQNLAAQENIQKALVDSYAKAVNTRRYIQDIVQKRQSTISALVQSSDSYEDLLAKANKGVEFYTKLETNVSKLLQRIKSACKVQQEEREQMLKKDLAKNTPEADPDSTSAPAAPKLKDYLDSRKRNPMAAYSDTNLQYPQQPTVNYAPMELPPGVRPAPLGSEVSDIAKLTVSEQSYTGNMGYGYNTKPPFGYQQQQVPEDGLSKKMMNLSTNPKDESQYHPQSYSPYIPQDYTPTSYAYPTQVSLPEVPLSVVYDPNKAYTTTVNSYKPYSKPSIPGSVTGPMQYQATPSEKYQYPVHASNSFTQPTPAPSTNNSTYNVNTYYPAGYGPNTTLTGDDTSQNVPASPSSNQYHSVEYATSVQPNNVVYSYSSTYSSPSPNLNTSGYYPNTSGNEYYNASETQQQYQSQYQYYGTQQGAGYIQGTNGSNIVPPGGISPSSVVYGDGTYSYTYATTTPQNASATVVGYGGTAYAANSTPVYPSGTTNATNTYPTDNAGSTPTPSTNNTGTYQTGSTAEYQASTTTVYPAEHYSGYYGQNYATNYPGYYTEGAASQAVQPARPTPAVQPAPPTPAVQQQQVQAANTAPTTTKESNIDLLSGLDFTISQAPLVPQQNVSNTSTTDTMSAAPDKSESATNTSTKKEIEEKKSSPEVKRPKMKIIPSKTIDNADICRLFVQELDKFEKCVETLPNKTLSGPTNLDLKWKEIQDKQDSDGQKKIISVARCYPMKNRFPDILPYDHSRVELCTTKDDYINASFVKDVSPYAPLLIISQVPLASTISDFWAMVREQQVELIFCLVNDSEIGTDVYWPTEKGRNLSYGNMILSLQSVITKTHWVERLISITINTPDKRDSWVVFHLQFTSWPGSLCPNSPEPVVSYIQELLTLYKQQRDPGHPVVVQCPAGVGRSGVVCTVAAAILEAANNANVLPDLATLAAKISACRANALRDREHLKFVYECFLGYMKQIAAAGDISFSRLKETSLSRLIFVSTFI